MRRIELSQATERIRGITLPEDGVLYICDYDTVFKINIQDNVKTDTIDEEPLEFFDSHPNALGIMNNKGVLESNGNSIFYDFNPSLDSVFVQLDIQSKSYDIEFPTLSGDWFVASFSQCGKYILLAEPYSFELYEI